MLIFIQACGHERKLVPWSWDWSKEYIVFWKCPSVFQLCFLVNVVTFKNVFAIALCDLVFKEQWFHYSELLWPTAEWDCITCKWHNLNRMRNHSKGVSFHCHPIYKLGAGSMFFCSIQNLGYSYFNCWATYMFLVAKLKYVFSYISVADSFNEFQCSVASLSHYKWQLVVAMEDSISVTCFSPCFSPLLFLWRHAGVSVAAFSFLEIKGSTRGSECLLSLHTCTLQLGS